MRKQVCNKVEFQEKLTRFFNFSVVTNGGCRIKKNTDKWVATVKVQGFRHTSIESRNGSMPIGARCILKTTLWNCKLTLRRWCHSYDRLSRIKNSLPSQSDVSSRLRMLGNCNVSRHRSARYFVWQEISNGCRSNSISPRSCYVNLINDLVAQNLSRR